MSSSSNPQVHGQDTRPNSAPKAQNQWLIPSPPVSPQKKTFFGIGYAFVSLEADGTIPTQSFIHASRGVAEFIGTLRVP